MLRSAVVWFLIKMKPSNISTESLAAGLCSLGSYEIILKGSRNYRSLRFRSRNVGSRRFDTISVTTEVVA